MMSPILIGLVRIACGLAVAGGLETWGAKKCERDGVVGRLVRAVLGVGQDRGSKASARVGQIDPPVRHHLKLAIEGVRTLDRADLLVVGCVWIGRRKRKGNFEVHGGASPVDLVAKFDTIARVSGGEADGLDKLGPGRLACYFEAHADRSALLDANLSGPADVSDGSCLLLVEIHVPRGPLLRVVV